MTDTIIAGLLAILGVVIGILSTHLIHYIDRKFEERKLVNESIHYLLEVYFLISRLNPQKLMNAFFDYYFQRIRKHIPGDDKSFESAKEQLSPIIKKLLVLIAQQSYEELESLGKQYEEMVAKLATILPIDAYYLRGKNNLEKLIRTLSDYFNSIKELDIDKDSTVNEFIDQMQMSVTAKILDDYKKDLKSELRELLGETTRFNRRKGKEVITKLESSVLTDEDKREIDTLIVSVASKVISNVNQTEIQ